MINIFTKEVYDGTHFHSCREAIMVSVLNCASTVLCRARWNTNKIFHVTSIFFLSSFSNIIHLHGLPLKPALCNSKKGFWPSCPQLLTSTQGPWWWQHWLSWVNCLAPSITNSFISNWLKLTNKNQLLWVHVNVHQSLSALLKLQLEWLIVSGMVGVK